MTTKTDIVNLLERYLKSQLLSDDAIRRIVNEDLEYLLNWELQPSSEDDLSQAQAVIAFSFGYGPEKPGVSNAKEHPYHPLLHKPGKSNIAMTHVIEPFLKAGKAVFAQWEVAEALSEVCGIRIKDDYIARPDKQYLGTSGVVRKFLDKGLKSDDYKKIIVVAHRHHTYRCLKITEKVFLDENLQKQLLVANNPDVYDPDSLQDWTKSLENWVAYEVGNRFRNRFQKNM